jgi:hypothetical protein
MDGKVRLHDEAQLHDEARQRGEARLHPRVLPASRLFLQQAVR